MVLENIRVTHDCYVQRLGIAAVHLQNNKKIVIINIFFYYYYIHRALRL